MEGVDLPHLRATLTVNTDRFSLVRFGVPHTRAFEGGVSTVVFEAKDLAADQDRGVSFVTDKQALDRVAEVVGASPLATGLSLMLPLARADFGTWPLLRGIDRPIALRSHTG